MPRWIAFVWLATVVRDSWYVIFSQLSLAIGLALLLFVTLSAGPKPAGNLSQGSADFRRLPGLPKTLFRITS